MSDQSSQLDRIESKVDDVWRWVYGGNGGEKDNPGAKIRVDRLEQSEERRTRALWLTFTAAVSALVASGWQLLTRGGSP